MDVIGAAKKISEAGANLDKFCREVADQVKCYILISTFSLWLRLAANISSGTHHKIRFPFAFANYFNLNKQIHDDNTQTINDLHIAHINSEYCQRSIQHKAGILWNQLRAELQYSSSDKSFAQLKICIHSAQNVISFGIHFCIYAVKSFMPVSSSA